jgi:hypothetical protein
MDRGASSESAATARCERQSRVRPSARAERRTARIDRTPAPVIEDIEFADYKQWNEGPD